MRYGKEHKKETRGRILRAAGRLFRENGYDGVGVDAVMSEAGLTAGGFYAHFPSKEALFSEVIAGVLAERNASLAEQLKDVEGLDWLSTLVKIYLSRTHRDLVGEGCPLPTLTPDVIRSGESTRENYEDQLRQYLEAIEAQMPEGSQPSQDRALALIAQCVGGLMIARAVKDEALSNQI